VSKKEMRCKVCGFRIRSPRHDEGPHHSRRQIGVAGEAVIMSQGRPARKP